MRDRFDLEALIIKCWNVTEDIDTVAGAVDDTDMSANDKDKILNMLHGIRELYNVRFNTTLSLFEELVHNGTISSKIV